MVVAMDPTQASCQIQFLLTELHSRFPEVPVEEVAYIMQQVYLTIEMLSSISSVYRVAFFRENLASRISLWNSEMVGEKSGAKTKS